MKKFSTFGGVAKLLLQFNGGAKKPLEFTSVCLQSRGYAFDPHVQGMKMYSERQLFESTRPIFVGELMGLDIHPLIAQRYNEVVEYNIHPSRRARALTLIYTYRKLTGNQSSMEHDPDIRKLYALAWCSEYLLAWSHIIDDMVDKSEYRHGKVAWYYKQKQSPAVLYDSDFVRESSYKLMDKYFADDLQKNVEFSRIFRKVNLNLACAEIVELESRNVIKEKNRGEGTLDHYSRDVFNVLAHLKCGYEAFHFPLSLAYVYAEKHNPNIEKIIADVNLDIGEFFQGQDDYCDIYVDPKKVGKCGTDIQMGVCSLFLVKALEICTPKQKRILESHYGVWGDEHEQEVRKVFEDLRLESWYQEYESQQFTAIQNKVSKLPDETLKDVMSQILEDVISRKQESHNHHDG